MRLDSIHEKSAPKYINFLLTDKNTCWHCTETFWLVTGVEMGELNCEGLEYAENADKLTLTISSNQVCAHYS